MEVAADQRLIPSRLILGLDQKTGKGIFGDSGQQRVLKCRGNEMFALQLLGQLRLMRLKLLEYAAGSLRPPAERDYRRDK